MKHEATCPVCRAMDTMGIKGAKRAYIHQLVDLQFMADRVAGMAHDQGIEIIEDELDTLIDMTCELADEPETPTHLN